MRIDVAAKNNGTAVVTVEVSVEETKPFLEGAAKRLAHKHQLSGFRPGKAPLSVIKSQFGDAALYDEVIQELIPKTLVQALRDKRIESVGQPEVSVEKLAPGNPIVYTATVAIMPVVTLNNWRSVTVKKQTVAVEDKGVTAVIDELREMQAKEVVVDRAAKVGDKVEMNFEVKRDGVVIEGGKGTRYPIILGKGSMIPGFEEQTLGLKKNETKTFQLTFPEKYMQENLAGKQADFSIEVISVFERELPKADDDWAKAMMGKSYQELRSAVRENLETEQRQKEQRRLEHALMTAIVQQANFSVIPDIMLQSEVQKMVAELQDDVAARGMQWDRYLESIKKTVEELEKEFSAYADERVKSALAIRSLTDELKLAVAQDELDAELARQKELYKDNNEAIQRLGQPEYREYLKRVLLNRKTVDNLVSLLV